MLAPSMKTAARTGMRQRKTRRPVRAAGVLTHRREEPGHVGGNRSCIHI